MLSPTLRGAITAPLSFATVMVLAVAVLGCQTPRDTGRVQMLPSALVQAAGKLVWTGSYSQHIQAIFDRRCVACHGRDRSENGLKLTSFEEVMRGTRYGPVVVPGSPSHSTLVSVVKGTADRSIRMPLGERRLTDQEVQNLVLWIEVGAPPN